LQAVTSEILVFTRYIVNNNGVLRYDRLSAEILHVQGEYQGVDNRKYIDDFGFQNKITLIKARSTYEESIELAMTGCELRKEI
jgi:hypothetical protein